MLPWLAHGHISTFLELAKILAKRNIKVYLCSTPINLSSIKERILESENQSLSIQMVEIHLPYLPELSPHFHIANGLPTHLNPTLRKVFEMESSSISNILKALKPDLPINDFLQLWVASIASTKNIQVIEFSTTSAAAGSFCYHAIIYPDVEYRFPLVYLRDFELAKLHPSLKSLKSLVGIDQRRDRELKSPLRSHDILLINNSNEIEEKCINYLSSLRNQKIMPFGPLVQDSITEDEHLAVLEWLGKNDNYSSVFVSFGSENFLSNEEMEEIAQGLELSNVNFIWAIRFPMREETMVDKALLAGFLERVIDRGITIKGWAPQAIILRQPIIGGFVSHCGWNSLMENLKFGVPIIAIPMHHDYPLNARLMVEVGLGMEVMRDENARLHREEVAKVIREVIVEKKGEHMMRKARDLHENMRLKGEKEIEEVVAELAQLCQKSKD